ncbi:lipoate--protein ligase family protein [Allofranklinella schreckenbergeri]|uniref:Lipoate--protein ligase family protein n=1 Tax=Allofranklinella schreckenbergeri TaxID=1076744 RepID=A0A3M6QEB1_9BURK|nr:lipoate--protein ligase family protein [Allofranklinella schreckenbergeri]RRD44002.1 lipoate--protein ligase family protein [Comamonadaceae bacterium OH3737_COT-264]
MNAFHGEYKVPGGKLVVVDLQVQDGRLHDVQVTGDFFLDPEEALEAISASLNGQSAEAGTEQLAAAVRAALPEGAALFGFSPEAVGIAVRRALGVAKTWRDYEWQIVHDTAVSPYLHAALDEVLSQEVAAGRRPPTLRIWEWDSTAVVLGVFQSLRNEVDVEAARRHGATVVRRITGGGAMFIEAGNSITYSLYAPEALVSELSIADSYAFLDDWVLQALKSLGVEAFYKPLNDISSEHGKIGGAAQKRFRSGHTVLHHVTMAYDMDAQKMTEVLRIGREKLSDKGTLSAVKRVDPLRSQTGLPRADIIECMKQTFMQLYGGQMGYITEAEMAAAQELAHSKFATQEWLHKLP